VGVIFARNPSVNVRLQAGGRCRSPDSRATAPRSSSRERIAATTPKPSAAPALVAEYLDVTFDLRGSPVAFSGLSDSLTAGRPLASVTLQTSEIASSRSVGVGAQSSKSLVRLCPSRGHAPCPRNAGRSR
jgi:hypothetical protein